MVFSSMVRVVRVVGEIDLKFLFCLFYVFVFFV